MARCLGIGGIFFKSRDPGALAAWYKKWLEVPVDFEHGASFHPQALPAGAMGVWSPFPADTAYFEPSPREFMINLIVDDLEGALDQVRKGGAEVMEKTDSSEFGAFGWFIDPEGNKVELWVPPAPKS